MVCAARTGAEIEEVAAEIRNAGGRALAQPTDVSDLASVEAMVAATLAAWGRLDLLVINAGICPDMGRSIFESEAQEWVDTVAINLNGAYFCVKAAAPHMRESGGHMILIGSGKGHRAMPNDSAYACSKAGAWMLVRTMAEELASSRICINELIPGPVDTPMNPKGRDQPLGERVAQAAGGRAAAGALPGDAAPERAQRAKLQPDAPRFAVNAASFTSTQPPGNPAGRGPRVRP